MSGSVQANKHKHRQTHAAFTKLIGFLHLLQVKQRFESPNLWLFFTATISIVHSKVDMAVHKTYCNAQPWLDICPLLPVFQRLLLIYSSEHLSPIASPHPPHWTCKAKQWLPNSQWCMCTISTSPSFSTSPPILLKWWL